MKIFFVSKNSKNKQKKRLSKSKFDEKKADKKKKNKKNKGESLNDIDYKDKKIQFQSLKFLIFDQKSLKLQKKKEIEECFCCLPFSRAFLCSNQSKMKKKNFLKKKKKKFENVSTFFEDNPEKNRKNITHFSQFL